MDLELWYKTATPRKEVREGRSFNPDEFAIALEQVVAGNAPEDYKDPAKFFSRTAFTRALREHVGMVLRRLAGETANTAPVLTLVTQFGGGKTHTLTTLYHLIKHAEEATTFAGISELLQDAKLADVPHAQIAVFVGNAWDPQPGRETPWIDIARQLAGERGVEILGLDAKNSPPGTEALGRLFEEAGGSVLILMDEVLNFINRHRALAEPFYAYLQNISVAMTGNPRGAMVVSLPRSRVEMTESDQQWQEKITKIVRRVAKDLIANDEAEIGEVVRLRLFENIGDDRVRKRVARAYANWCFEQRAQLPPEWTAIDTAVTEAKAREFLQARFEACYPFHPATLSVFQRKWSVLPQYQQTRGTIAMFAQWISLAYHQGFKYAKPEPLLTLGSAPLDNPEFRAVVLGQLGESRLAAAIDADIASDHSHARVLDADTKDNLKEIHRRVGAAILFESSGGQTDKVAHLPELRFALGNPFVDTTSVDVAASSLEARAFFIRRVSSDGFRIHHQATLKKVVSDRRASLDEENEVRPAMRNLVKAQFEKGRSVPAFYSPADSAGVPDSPKLTLVVMDPTLEWSSDSSLRQQIAEWTKRRGTSDRLYPGALLWCVKQSGRSLHDKVEAWLAWKRVKREVDDGTLGSEYDISDKNEIQSEIREAEEKAQEEVWASYRFVVLADNKKADGLDVIDLGSGHSGHGETLTGRILAALKSGSLLNESPGTGYLERRWPPTFKDTGAWPLISLRQAFLTGALDRLLDPDAYLRTKVPEFVERGDFGLASGGKGDGTFERVWFKEFLPSDEVAFDADVFLLKKTKAQELKADIKPTSPEPVTPSKQDKLGELSNTLKETGYDQKIKEPPVAPAQPALHQLQLFGEIPPEVWNRLGTKIVPKLRSGQDLKLEVRFVVNVPADASKNLINDLKQALQELGIADKIAIEEK